MACSTCGPAKVYLPPTPAPAPSPPACAGTEPCFEIQDAACVAYTGQPLEYLGINTDDRLNKILEEMNQAFAQVGKGRVYFKGSRQIEVVGEGSAEDPYHIRPIIDPVPHNLLKAKRAGLSVLLDKPAIMHLLQCIAEDPELKEALCAIGCVGQPVSYPTPENLQVVVSTTLSTPTSTAFALTWEMPQAQQLTQPEATTVRVQLRAKNGISNEWQNVGAPLPSTTLTATVSGKLNNTLYEFRVINAQDPLQLAASEVVESARPMAVGTVTPVVGETSLKFTFAELGADVSEYRLILKKGTQVIANPLKPAAGLGGQITHTFTGLLNQQAYHLDIVTLVGSFSVSTDKGLFTPEGSDTPVDPTPTTCTSPTSVSASLIS